ncbi:MAG: hypothetical protein D6711_09295 [Chloroflexi bacterium]|nr:MAG: hypothetical protein D6711_09295 [Chloroflexota bacterium]
MTDCVDRELAAVKNSVVSDVQSLQIAPFLPGQTLYDVTQSGLSLSDSRFSTRRDELTDEMEDRGKPQLFTYIDAQTANYRVNAVTDILRYHDQIIANQTPKNDILQSLSKPAPFAQQVSAPDTQGTLIELLQMAEGESETARLAQLEILNTLGVMSSPKFMYQWE